MGNEASRPQIIREYVLDPALLQQVAEVQKTNAHLLVEFAKLSERIAAQGLDSKIESFEDLKRYDEKAATALITLAQNTEAMKMEGQNFGFFGVTSSGKSSIINKLLGEDRAAVGPCETTTGITPYKGPSNTLYDIPGRNDEMSYFSMELISFWKGLTSRVVVISATVKEMSKVLSILDAMNLKYHIVFNKFDNVTDDEREECKKKIQKETVELGLKGVEDIWFVSAKDPGQFGDWNKMADYLATDKKLSYGLGESSSTRMPE